MFGFYKIFIFSQLEEFVNEQNRSHLFQMLLKSLKFQKNFNFIFEVKDVNLKNFFLLILECLN